MATVVISNRERTSAVLHFTASTADLPMTGNTSVCIVAKDDETVNGVTITQATFGSPSGNGAYWKILRGANTVAVLDSTAQIDFAGAGMALNQYPTANLSVELVGSSDGFLALEVQKINAQSEYYS